MRFICVAKLLRLSIYCGFNLFNFKCFIINIVAGDTVTLTEEQLQEAVNQGQIIDTAAAENMIMQVNDTGVHAVKLGTVGGVCLTDNEEEEEEEEETEDDINVLNRNIHSMVSEMSD